MLLATVYIVLKAIKRFTQINFLHKAELISSSSGCSSRQTTTTKKLSKFALYYAFLYKKQIITSNCCLFDHLALWCLLRARGEFTAGRLQKIVFKVPNILSRGGLLFILPYLYICLMGEFSCVLQ